MSETIQRAWNWLRGEKLVKEFKPNLPHGQVYLGDRFVFNTSVRGRRPGESQLAKAAHRTLDTMLRNQ